HCFAPGITPYPPWIESPGSTRRRSLGRRCRLRRLDLLCLVDSSCFLQIADEGVLEGSAAALLDQLLGRADREHSSPMHQRNSVAALSLVHEVGRKEDCDAVIAGEVDQRAPERVASDRGDAGGRLVENEKGRPV